MQTTREDFLEIVDAQPGLIGTEKPIYHHGIPGDSKSQAKPVYHAGARGRGLQTAIVCVPERRRPTGCCPTPLFSTTARGTGVGGDGRFFRSSRRAFFRFTLKTGGEMNILKIDTPIVFRRTRKNYRRMTGRCSDARRSRRTEKLGPEAPGTKTRGRGVDA